MLFNYLIDELEKVTQGAYILATHALIEGDFKELMVKKSSHMIEEIEKDLFIIGASALED